MLGKPEYQKPLGEKTKGQNQKHNQPSYGVNAGSRTRATLEVSAHTTAPALLLTRKADVEMRDRSVSSFYTNNIEHGVIVLEDTNFVL